MTRVGPVILIVEDEFLLRLDSAETIESAGFEVIQAANADEAIAILKARPDIHVVFTDIQMPGSMDGLKLARFVRDRWPRIKIVATSGHVTVDEDDLPDGSVFLPKPYRGAHVVATLRELVLLSQAVAVLEAENQVVEEIQFLARGGPDGSRSE
jgi:two-component system, response regulator PdtaR